MKNYTNDFATIGHFNCRKTKRRICFALSLTGCYPPVKMLYSALVTRFIFSRHA